MHVPACVSDLVSYIVCACVCLWLRVFYLYFLVVISLPIFIFISLFLSDISASLEFHIISANFNVFLPEYSRTV